MILPHAVPSLDPQTLDDAGWLRLADTTPVGQRVRLTRLTATAFFRLFALGFWRESHREWRRLFDWRTPRPLVPCEAPGLPALGGIVIASVARAQDAQAPAYIYRTLRSLFASMPQGIEVNVFVGGAEAGYVAHARLADVLGVECARRVHIVRADAREAQFLARHATVRQRTTWNHMRALRSYQQGEGRLLFLEDDIAWTRYASRLVGGAVYMAEPELISLYHGEGFDRWCWAQRPCQQEVLELVRGRRNDLIFSCCQALLYHASLSRRVADYLSLRFDPLPVDWTMSNYFCQSGTLLGWARPSPVQHVGRQTAVNRPFHEAKCFVPDDTSG